MQQGIADSLLCRVCYCVPVPSIFKTMIRRNMDAKTIMYGETALDKLVQWLKSTGKPQDVDEVVKRYLAILRNLIAEEQK